MTDDNAASEGHDQGEGQGGKAAPKRMGRPPKDDTAKVISIRLTQADRNQLDGLVERQRRWLAAAAVPLPVGPADIIRTLVRRETAAGGEGPITEAPALALATNPAPAGPVEHPETTPDPLPPERERPAGQLAQLAAVVAGAVAGLVDADELVRVPALVRRLAPLALDRRDVADGLEVLRRAGAVELRPEASPRLYPPADQRLALPGPRGSVVMAIAMVGPLAMVPPAAIVLSSAPLANPPGLPASAPIAASAAHPAGKGSAKATPAPPATGEAAAPDLLTRVQTWCEAYDAAGKPHRGGQAALAALVGCDKSVITRWKNGAAPLPAADQTALMKALRRSPEAVRRERAAG